LSGPDCTGNAETNLMRLASRRYGADFLAGCSLYTSTEPCPMCAGAIYWGNIRRIVFGLGQEEINRISSGSLDTFQLGIPCREIFDSGDHAVEVIGPALEDEALSVHDGFWI